MILTCKAFLRFSSFCVARVSKSCRDRRVLSWGLSESVLEHGRDEQTPLQGAWCASLNPGQDSNERWHVEGPPRHKRDTHAVSCRPIESLTGKEESEAKQNPRGSHIAYVVRHHDHLPTGSQLFG